MEKKRGFLAHFNFLDWLIIILVILIVGGTYYGLNHRNKSAGTVQTHISYDLEVKAVSSAFADNVKTGDLIKESTRNNKMGQVTNVSVKPAISLNPDMVNGKFVQAVVPELYDVIITVETNATMSAKDIVTDGLSIKVGKKIFIKGRGYANAAFVLAMRL